MERSLRAARVATYIYFVLCGTLMGAWVVHMLRILDAGGLVPYFRAHRGFDMTR